MREYPIECESCKYYTADGEICRIGTRDCAVCVSPPLMDSLFFITDKVKLRNSFEQARRSVYAKETNTKE